MKSSTLVSSTKTVVDSLAAANQSVAKTATINSSFGSLPDLKKLLGKWKASIAGETKSELAGLNGTAALLKGVSARFQKVDLKQIVADLKRIKPQLVALRNRIGKTEVNVSLWRDDLARVGAAIRSEVASRSAEIKAAQAELGRLQEAVRQTQDQIKYYEERPWQLVLDGFNLPSLIEKLNRLVLLLRAALDPKQIQRAEQALRDLKVAENSFGGLQASATGLSAALSGLTAAIGTTVTSVDSMIKSKPAKPVIIAEIKTIAAEYAAAAKAVK